jgi:hypothetical protein
VTVDKGPQSARPDLYLRSGRNVSATGWHRIEVRLTNRKGEVTARRGYDRGGP